MGRRILHVVRQMNRGGVEGWLVSLLGKSDPRRVRMDFLVQTSEPGEWDERVRRLGGRLIYCPGGLAPWTFALNLRRVLKRYGPYDVVHSHVHFASGLILWIARRAGVPVRLAHSHTDSRARDRLAAPWRRAYLTLARHWIRSKATNGLAVSARAARSLFGRNWRASGRVRILPCGVELAPVAAPLERAAVRRELGLAADEFVVGHVGRFVREKNHDFLLRIARAVPAGRFLLIGDGPLRRAVERRARKLGLGERVVFAGSRNDVPRLLQAMDCFLFPSRAEGLGLALVEAQAAGLPALVSDVVPAEADVVPGLVRRLPLSAPPAAWAEALVAMRERYGKHGAAFEIVRGSALSVRNAARAWMGFYESACAAAEEGS